MNHIGKILQYGHQVFPGIMALISASSGVYAGLKVPMPRKWLWLVGFGLAFVYSCATFLYNYGGRYSLLLPILTPSVRAFETIGTMSIAIGIYSTIYDGKISTHWYSLPTGCTPLSIFGQYYPTHWFEFMTVGGLLIHIFLTKKGTEWINCLVCLGIATICRNRLITIQYFDIYMVSFLFDSVSMILMHPLVAPEKRFGIGKLKLF